MVVRFHLPVVKKSVFTAPFLFSFTYKDKKNTVYMKVRHAMQSLSNLKEIPNDCIMLSKILQESRHEGYLVGGCVRDMLLGVSPHDWDMCTNATPEEMITLFTREGLTINPKGIEYGTVTPVIKGIEYEITTFRKETGYSDGRHPDEVSYSKTIAEDLCRRDFTINAMAIDMKDNTLTDLFHGSDDLNNGVIRMVGNPQERISEDPLRILRALRFAIKFGFTIDKNTRDAILSNKHLLATVSKERVTQELQKMLTCGKPIRDIFMEYADVIFEILPDLKPCYKFNQNSRYHKHDVYEHIINVVDQCDTDSFEIKLAALLHDIGKPFTYTLDEDGFGHFYGHADISFEMCQKILTEELRLTVHQREHILQLVKEHDHDMPITRKSIRRFVSEFGNEFIADWLKLKKADISDHLFPQTLKITLPEKYDIMMSEYNSFLAEESRFTVKDLKINGRDLMDIGIPQGKEIGDTLSTLFNMVLEEEICNEKRVLIDKAKELLDNNREDDYEM